MIHKSRGFLMLFKFLFLFLCCLLHSDEVSPFKAQDEYRNYTENASFKIKEFYYLNHTMQTVGFVIEKRKTYLPLCHGKMGIWEAMRLLDEIVDESDPDLHLNQTTHAFQTAEAIRRDGHPRWLILVGLIHDLGKLLTVFGEPQWAVVGDTFPVGCKFSDRVVFPEYFRENTDYMIPEYQTECGIYTPHCGLDALLMSWGHDEYLYQVTKSYLPNEASYIIRYHSFYALHREGAYTHLTNEYDQSMLPWLKLFSQYDLYSKVNESLDIEEIKPFFEELVREFFPKNLSW